MLIPASGVSKLKESLEEVLKLNVGGFQQTKPRKERPVDLEQKSRSVYVSGLTWATTEDELLRHMSAAGTVLSAVILRRGSRSLGCGIVEYASTEIALNAVGTMNDSDLNGRKVHCREDRDGDDVDETEEIVTRGKPPRRERERADENAIVPKERILNEYRIFFSNLSWTTTADTLKAFCAQLGTVTAGEILTAKNSQRSIGFGFVEFADPGSVQVAIANLNNQVIDGRTVTVREYYHQ